MSVSKFHLTSSPTVGDEWAGLTQCSFNTLAKLVEFVEDNDLIIIKIVEGYDICVDELELQVANTTELSSGACIGRP
jgi:hypothetical protein